MIRWIRDARAIDVLVVLAGLGIFAALLRPALSARGFRQRVEEAVADIETITGRARTSMSLLGRWPTGAPPGETPAELSGITFARPTYSLAWTTWAVVDSAVARTDDVGPAAPGDAPPATAVPALEPVVRVVGAVAVHAGDAALLAELLQRFGDRESFVVDTTWVRILPDRTDAPPAAP